jgi:Trk K+ transport system NAD-binding subunit
MTSIASPLISDDTLEASFVLLLLLDLGAAVGLGLATGKTLQTILGTPVHRFAKIAAVLALGFGVYELADWVKVWSTDSFGFEIYIEPLLISLIGGFFVTNFTPYRDEFDDLLHQIGPVVYVAFFTITGLALKLDLLLSVLPVALVLFVVRAAGIRGGSWLGGTVAGAPVRFRRISWMAFITQAGIALGLAREVAVQFPTLGDAFATLIISVVVVNEVVGPLFLKAGLRRAGEAHEPADAPGARARGVLVLGVEGQTIALARALQAGGWEVVVADVDAAQVERLAAADVDERHVATIDDTALAALIDDRTQAVVAVLGDDTANLRALRYAFEEHGISRLVVRPAGREHLADFEELGAFVVDPTSAMVALFEQVVTAPQSASLLMHRDPNRVVAQVTVSNPDVTGVAVRQLRLPPDVLLLELVRDASTVVVSGHTTLRHGDEVVLIADPETVEEVRMRLGG